MGSTAVHCSCGAAMEAASAMERCVAACGMWAGSKASSAKGGGKRQEKTRVQRECDAGLRLLLEAAGAVDFAAEVEAADACVEKRAGQRGKARRRRGRQGGVLDAQVNM